LASSLTNLANLQSNMGQREAALATAQEAADLYRELVRLNRDAFAADYARVHGVLGHILNGLARSQEAALAFETGVREILPEVQKYPAAHLPLALTLVRGYIASLQTAQLELDETLVQQIASILGPYLSKEGDER
jgi:tetratricopeptide (TPR) repeat protein